MLVQLAQHARVGVVQADELRDDRARVVELRVELGARVLALNDVQLEQVLERLGSSRG